jgi:IS30 family transposase
MRVIACPTRRSIAIYLFKPAGVLKKELLCHLRSRRTIRRSKRAGLNGDGRGQIKDIVSIRERPAAVEDRAVPGHWEGDLLSGSKNSYIATLVERHTRYVMLAKVANKDTETVILALIKQAKVLPNEPYKSLTWDPGKELRIIDGLRWKPTSTFTSAIPRVRGSADPTRTPMVC